MPEPAVRVEANTRQAVGLEGGIKPNDQEIQDITRAQIARRKAERMADKPHDVLLDFKAEVKAKQHREEAIPSGDPVKLKKAGDAERMVRNAAEKPFKDLASPEQEALVNASNVAIGRIPELSGIKDYLDGLPPLDRMKVISGMLENVDHDGAIGAALLKGDREFLAQAFPKIESLVAAENALGEKQEELRIAEEQAALVRVQEDEKKVELAQAEAQVKEASRTSAINKDRKAAEAVRSKFLAKVVASSVGTGKTEKDIAEIFAGKDTLRARMDALDNQLDTIVRISATDPRLPALRAEYAELTTHDRIVQEFGPNALDEASAQLREVEERARVQAESKVQAQASVKRLNTEIAELGAEKTAAEGEVVAVQGEITATEATINAEKVNQEDAYVKTTENIMAEVLEKMYRERLEAGERTQEADLQAMIDKEIDPKAKKILEAISGGVSGRWKRIDNSGRVVANIPGLRQGENLGQGEVRRYNNVLIKKDALMFIDQGQDAFMKNLIAETEFGGRNFAALTPSEQAEVDNLYANPRFQTGGDVADRAARDLFRYALQRKQLKTSDIERFEETPFGASIMTQAKKEHAVWLKKQMENTGFKGKVEDFLKHNHKGKMFLLLLLLWPGGAIAVGTVALGKEVLSKRKAAKGVASPTDVEEGKEEEHHEGGGEHDNQPHSTAPVAPEPIPLHPALKQAS